jgi:hypothetical protein
MIISNISLTIEPTMEKPGRLLKGRDNVRQEIVDLLLQTFSACVNKNQVIKMNLCTWVPGFFYFYFFKSMHPCA